uniref:Uncharacterized protein n=1 Tax=Arundo donax TaxID=35708 RepID=A0A0A8Y3S0_ARUDO
MTKLKKINFISVFQIWFCSCSKISPDTRCKLCFTTYFLVHQSKTGGVCFLYIRYV